MRTAMQEKPAMTAPTPTLAPTTPHLPIPTHNPDRDVWDDTTIRRLIWAATAVIGIAVLAAIIAWPTPVLDSTPCPWEDEAIIQTVHGPECRPIGR